jgi:hypothetical protein
MTGMGKGPLRIAIEDFLATFGLGEKISKWFTSKAENQERLLLGDYKAIIDELAKVPELKQFLDFDKLLSGRPGHQMGLVGGAGMALGAGSAAASAMLGPIMRVVNYTMDKWIQSARIDIGQIIAANWRNKEYNKIVGYDASELGWTQERRDILQDIMRPRLGEQGWIVAWLRGQVSDGEIKAEFAARGYLDADIAQMLTLSQQIPQPNDLIRMAVREAWNEEIVQRFQYDAGFPPEFAEWMGKQGYSPEWSKRYWRAHWELPGLAAGYEMLHRLRPGETDNPFTEQDIESLLKTADIPEFFRKRLIEVSYSPYTRVDVRRMYGAGVLTAEQVYKSYRDLGYNDERAKNLTAFTTTVEHAEEKGLTKDAATSGYKRGIISHADAASMLADLGYNADDAEFWLSLVDYDLAADLTDQKLAAIRTEYVAGLLDETTINDKLGPLNLPAERQTGLLSLWTAQRDAKIKLPSKSELEDFYERGLVDDTKFLEFLSQDGYRSDVIPMYLQTLNLELAEKAAKEAERTAKEADRLAKLKTATALQRTRSLIDAEIASVVVSIADLRVALFSAEEPADITAIKLTIVQLQAYIAEQQLAKATASIVQPTSD